MVRANKRFRPTRSASVASLPPLRVRLNRKPLGAQRDGPTQSCGIASDAQSSTRKWSMVSVYAIPPTAQQEEFSRAYIAAVASAAGYSVQRRSVDVDCIDLSIHQRSDGNSVPLIDCLGVQLKCTYAHQPKNGYLHFPLDIVSYDNLRQERLYAPRILVVVHVPRNVGDWLTHAADAMILRHCAYWMSLRGMPAVGNTASYTIRIPTDQRFTVDALQEIMNHLAKGVQL